MTTTTTTTNVNDDIMTLSSYAAIVNETLPHSPELQLCIQDLVHPTESAETLLETLSNEQLSIIEQAVTKIKERKFNLSKDQVITTTPALSTVPTLTPNSPIDPSTSSVIIKEPTWDVEAQVAKALADVISTSTATTTTATTTTTNNTASSSQSTLTTINNDIGKSSAVTSATATTTAGNTKSTAKPPTTPSPFLSSHEPTTEIREGVEWVSFVYSHHRTLRRYCIRTDLDKVDTNILDEKFKKENCVYPRANLPRETYRGNRWAYETECNELGWKLAFLNLEEIAGKRGLIQRAVDSYRNRYPSMRSRRVARQEKLLKGTLRKRKHRDNEDSATQQPQQKTAKTNDTIVEKAPKTILMEDANNKCRIRINIESIALDTIDIAFRKNNCVFPRALHITPETPNVSQRRLDEAKCNEIGWKLAWLNPRQLANKKNLLQRALDTYRNQFTVDLKPRKYASRLAPQPYVPPPPQPPPQSAMTIKHEPIPLTEEALLEQQKEYEASNKRLRRNSNQSCYSGTTVTLDFHDYCFSPPAEEEESPQQLAPLSGQMFDILAAALPHIQVDDVLSEGSSNTHLSSYQNTPSPESLMTFYQQALLLNNNSTTVANASVDDNEPPSAVVDFMAKFQNVVDAGMGDFTADPTLLQQLF